MSQFLPGQPNDAYVYIWNVWNFWNQIFNHLNPFFTKNVMYPLGANLFFHTNAPFVSVIALPFLNDLPKFINLLILASITASSFVVYLLIHKISKNKVASFIGGLLYGVSPIMHSFIQSQHYYFLFSTVSYPLGLLFLVNYFKSKKLKYLYLTTFSFWIVLATDYYSAVLYAFLISVFFLLNENLTFDKVSRYLAIGIIGLLVPYLTIVNLEPNFKRFVSYKQTANSSSSCNSRLSGFITPNISNPILGYDHTINLDTPSYFLGWGIVLLAVLSSIKYSKYKYIKSLIFICLFFLWLSLGTSIKLTPFHYFLKAPILGSIDCPIRFPIISQLCISVLVAFYISKHKKYIKAAIAILILIAVEYGVTNKDFSSTKIPTIYSYIKGEQADKTLLEIPSGITESKGAFGYDWSIQALHSQQMYWQTWHEKRRVGAYMSRITPDKYAFFKSEPVISDIFNYSSLGGIKPTIKYSEKSIENFIQKFNLGYIVLSPNVRQDDFSIFIETNFKKFIKNKITIDDFVLYEL